MSNILNVDFTKRDQAPGGAMNSNKTVFSGDISTISNEKDSSVLVMAATRAENGSLEFAASYNGDKDILKEALKEFLDN